MQAIKAVSMARSPRALRTVRVNANAHKDAGLSTGPLVRLMSQP